MPHKPSLKSIEKEAYALLPVALAMVPIKYRVRAVIAVDHIEAGKAQVGFDDSADGGRCVDIMVSRHELSGERNVWRLRVLTRLVHEFMHIRTADEYEAAIRVTKNLKISFDLWEACCEASEGIVLYALQNGMKI
jgi:hypothetical protein